MAIAFRAAGTLTDTNTGLSSTVAKPAGLTAGDLVIVCFAEGTQTSNVISPPDNTWYQIPGEDNQVHGTNVRFSLYYHVATNSEPTWTFTFSANIRHISLAVAYSGVSGIDIGSWAMGTGSTAATIATTSTNSGDTAVAFVLDNSAVGGASVSLSGSLTSRFSGNTGDVEFSLAVGDANVATTSVPAYTNTVGDGACWFAPVVVLTSVGGTLQSVSNVGTVPTGATTTGTTSVAATVPTAIQNGDILVAFVQITYSSSGSSTQTTIATPAGWTKQDEFFQNPTSGTFTLHGAFYTHTVTNQAGEPGTYTWSTSGGSALSNIEVDMIAVRGCSALDSFARSHSGGGDVASLSLTGVTVTSDNGPLLVWGMGSSNAGGPSTGVAGLEGEVGSGSHGIWSTAGGVNGSTTQTYTWITLGISTQLLGYQVAFVSALSNRVKFVSQSVVSRYTGVTSQAITIPSGTQANDLLIAHVMGPSGGTITPPAGWTLITNATADNGSFKASCYFHVVAGGDPSSVTFSFSGSTAGCASIIALRNALSGVITSSNSTSGVSTPTLNNVEAGSIVLMYQSTTGDFIDLEQDLFMAPLMYNPYLAGGTISRNGALSIILQTGANGGYVGQQYRGNSGSNTGPCMTIAIQAASLSPFPRQFGYKPTTKVLRILQAQKQAMTPARVVRPTLFAKLAKIQPTPPPPPPPPPPVPAGGIRQDLWISVRTSAVYESTGQSTRITPES